MAIVRTYFHRTPARVAPHLRYIATREGASGLHGLGPHFRALRGDVEACVRLALGLPIPHVLVRTHTPLATRTVRLPYTS